MKIPSRPRIPLAANFPQCRSARLIFRKDLEALYRHRGGQCTEPGTRGFTL
jgi:hypothetical protein